MRPNAPTRGARVAEVVGLGLDLCEIARVQAALARHGERFAAKVLGEGEMAVFRARRAGAEARGVAFLASRFAAKEAFGKALGTGMQKPMSWHACEVLPDAAGRPQLHLHGELAAWMQAQGLTAMVSLTDERGMAAATVLLQTRG